MLVESEYNEMKGIVGLINDALAIESVSQLFRDL